MLAFSPFTLNNYKQIQKIFYLWFCSKLILMQTEQSCMHVIRLSKTHISAICTCVILIEQSFSPSPDV